MKSPVYVKNTQDYSHSINRRNNIKITFSGITKCIVRSVLKKSIKILFGVVVCFSVRGVYTLGLYSWEYIPYIL